MYIFFLFIWIKLLTNIRVFLRHFRDPIRVPRISNRVPTIREIYHRVPKIIENRVPRIREIGSLQIHTGYLTFSLKKNLPINLLFALDYRVDIMLTPLRMPFSFINNIAGSFNNSSFTSVVFKQAS